MKNKEFKSTKRYIRILFCFSPLAFQLSFLEETTVSSFFVFSHLITQTYKSLGVNQAELKGT